MIKATIFDLDGTLVQTEKLKALSYAKAAVELNPNLSEETVIAGFQDVVGRSRHEVAQTLIDRFGLQKKATQLMSHFKTQTAWEAYVQVRLKYYEAMISDPDILRTHQWTHNIDLLKRSRKSMQKVGLATMSHAKQVNRVLSMLDLHGQFDMVATRDDVVEGKPNPEIYLKVADAFAMSPKDILVIEDSPSGIAAALNAGMHCIAVTTPLTREHVHAAGRLGEEWIVDDPKVLLSVVAKRIAQAAETA